VQSARDSKQRFDNETRHQASTIVIGMFISRFYWWGEGKALSL